MTDNRIFTITLTFLTLVRWSTRFKDGGRFCHLQWPIATFTQTNIMGCTSHRVARYTPILSMCFLVPLTAVCRSDLFKCDGQRPRGQCANYWPVVMTPDRHVQMFPDPDVFRPERFLGRDALPPFTAAFGFGRRQCPGMHLTQNSLFILISKYVGAQVCRSATTHFYYQ